MLGLEAMTPAAVLAEVAFIAVLTQVLANRLHIPAIGLWLLVGVLLGPYALHWVHSESLIDAMPAFIDLGLAIILFEGGLNLNLKSIVKHRRQLTGLSMLGPLLTMPIVAFAAHTWVDLSWPIALLMGALAGIGGPAVMSPLLRQTPMDRDLRHLLMAESMLNEAFGAVLAVVVFTSIEFPASDLGHWLLQLLTTLGVGVGLGYLGGWVLCRVLRHGLLQDSELRSVFILVFSCGLFVFADSISHQSGLMAVLWAGAMLQRANLPDLHRLRHFKGALAILLVSILFVLIASQLNVPAMLDDFGAGVLLFVVMAFVARPLVVLLAGIGKNFSWQQSVFLSLMAPRGVVVAAVAALFASVLLEQGNEEALRIQSLSFVMVLLSVLFCSLVARPLARRLNVDGGDNRAVLIVGGGQMGAELGRVLSEDREVRFLDMNAEVVAKLRSSGFKAVCGNALDPIYIEVIHAEDVSTILVMTGSSDHNLLIAHQVQQLAHVRSVYIALQEGDENKHERMMHQLGAKRLFAKPYTFTYWNDQAARRRLVYEVQEIKRGDGLAGRRMGDVRIPHGVQPLAIVHQGQSEIPHDDYLLHEGDLLWLLSRPERLQEQEARLLPPSQGANGAAKA